VGSTAHLDQVVQQAGFDAPVRHDALHRGVVGLDRKELRQGSAEDHLRVHPYAAGGLLVAWKMSSARIQPDWYS
jgi:hypothetical protein